MIKRSEKSKILRYLSENVRKKKIQIPGYLDEKRSERKDLMIPLHLFIYAFILSIYDSFYREISS